MKYYYDTEFLEGTQTKSILGIPFGKTKPTIDLISIGITSEDNRELYLISKDFNLKEAWNRYDLKVQQVYGDARNIYPEGREYKEYFIRENVLKPIFIELWENEKGAKLTNADFNSGIFNYKHLKSLINKYGKTNKQIADEVITFVTGSDKINEGYGDYWSNPCFHDISLYGYYSAYDHVTLCWLFGKMIDLPKGFPMYTRDLKQMLDEKVEVLKLNRFGLLYERSREHDSPINIERLSIEEFYDYPKETNSHHSLSDAKWNKALYDFLNN